MQSLMIGICDKQTVKEENWEILKCEEKRLRARRSRILTMVSRLDIGLKFARSDFGKPGFISRGEISASLNLDRKVACVKERFARCEMKMEKVSDT